MTRISSVNIKALRTLSSVERKTTANEIMTSLRQDQLPDNLILFAMFKNAQEFLFKLIYRNLYKALLRVKHGQK